MKRQILKFLIRSFFHLMLVNRASYDRSVVGLIKNPSFDSMLRFDRCIEELYSLVFGLAEGVPALDSRFLSEGIFSDTASKLP